MELLKGKSCLTFKQTFYTVFLTSLVCYTGLYYILNLSYMLEKQVFTQMSYWVLSKTLPLTLFSITELHNTKLKFAKPFYFVSLSLTGLLALFAVAHGFSEFMPKVFGVKFHYQAAIEYLTFSIVMFYLFDKKLHNHFRSLTYTLMLLSVAGLLYELPVFHGETVFYHPSYPFYINPRWLMLPLITWKIGLSTFLSRLVLLAFAFCLLFSVYYFFFPNQPTWLPRLPTLTFLTVTTTKMKGVVGNNE